MACSGTKTWKPYNLLILQLRETMMFEASLTGIMSLLTFSADRTDTLSADYGTVGYNLMK